VDDDFNALDDLLSGDGAEPDPEAEPAPETITEASTEPNTEPNTEASTQAEEGGTATSWSPISAKEAKKGLAVRLRSEPSATGVIKKKAGNFSGLNVSLSCHSYAAVIR
jgi:hypothetical protein